MQRAETHAHDDALRERLVGGEPEVGFELGMAAEHHGQVVAASLL
jgi:hypothetical protein